MLTFILITLNLAGQTKTNSINDTLNILKVATNNSHKLQLEFYNSTDDSIAIFTGKLGNCPFNNFLTFQIDTSNNTVNINLLPNYINHVWYYPNCTDETDDVEILGSSKSRIFDINKDKELLTYNATNNCILLLTENTVNEINIRKQPSDRALSEFRSFKVIFWYAISFNLDESLVENRAKEYPQYYHWLNQFSILRYDSGLQLDDLLQTD